MFKNIIITCLFYCVSLIHSHSTFAETLTSKPTNKREVFDNTTDSSVHNNSAFIKTNLRLGSRILLDNVKLRWIDDIPHQVYQETRIIPYPSTDFTQTSLNIIFENLNEKDFEKLKSHYNSQTHLSWEENQPYSIIDFLPPIVQATVNHCFDTIQTSSEAPNKFLLSTSTNCWATSYEYLRNDNKNLTVFCTDYDIMESFLLDEKNGRLVDDKYLEYGDLLIIKDSLGVVHTAIMIDEKILFEKMDISNISLFRLTTIDAINKKYPLSRNQYLYKRFLVKPPHPSDIFSISSKGNIDEINPQTNIQDRLIRRGNNKLSFPAFFLITPIPYKINETTRRAELNPSAYIKSTFIQNTCSKRFVYPSNEEY